MESAIDQAGAPIAQTTVVKLAALWLDRSLTAAKRMANLITKMESHRTRRGPPDYETVNPQPYVVYGGHIGPPTTREPSWQKYALGIVAVVVGLGIPSIGGILW